MMLLALACVAGAQDPPPPGGGGGGTDYPRITNITASGSSATVEYYLDKAYTGDQDGNVRLQVYYDGFEIENRSISKTAGTYTTNVNLGRPNGYFYVRLMLELVDDPISGTWEKGIGRAFRLKDDGATFSLYLQAAWVGNEGVYTWPLRAKCPPGGCGGGASQGATVASCPIPDVQYSIDFPLGGGGGAAPCVSCGGGGGTGDNAYGPTFSIRLMAQYSSFNSSLSPGYFTPFDSQAFVFDNVVDQVTVVRVVDVEQADILTFRDGVEDNDLALSCQLLDANGIAADIEHAVKAVMTRFDGSQLEFSLYDVLDNDPTLDKDGRLTKLINPQGLATTVTYSTSNPGQMASVTGPNGQTVTFTYGSQIGGRETLSSVTLSDGNVVQFSDDDAHLTQASIGSSWSASFGIANDEEAQTANFSIQDGQGGGLTTLFTRSFFELHGSLLDQPEAIVRGVMNASGETISGTYFNPQDSSCYLVWRGTDYLSHVDIGVGECFMTNFSVGDPSLGYSAFTFTSETSYPRNIFMSGYTPNEFITGAPDQTLDAAGYTTSYAYDAQHFKTQASYGDGSSEHWVYNTRHQVTQHRDRLGRVTNYVYDTAGNLLEKHTGILRVNGVDTNQAEYGVWKYEYNTRGQLTKEKDPLFNPAQPDLHVTEYNYDASTWLLTSKV
ncbi:MAG: hypothetical protein ACYC56_14765, partial [Candidatus Aquicultor sp.]